VLYFSERHRLIFLGNAANTRLELMHLSPDACTGARGATAPAGFVDPHLIPLHRISRSSLVAIL